MATCTCKLDDGLQVDMLDPFCSVHGTTAQPVPTYNPEMPVIHELVRNDVSDRLRFGIAKYGTPLQPHNGRDALLDAYQDAIDTACYIRQAIFERDGK